ncbi:RNA-directed DNA polymerase, eukaryota [Tanacetum coccineum]
MAARSRSNEDNVQSISKYIFITNFLDSTTSADLWKLCQAYGTVVDVFIPNRRSKAGKRFAFVHFIKVFNVDRIVGNLCTLWIGRLHLHANVVRFERSPTQALWVSPPTRSDKAASSFVSAVKGVLNPPLIVSPAFVLDDSCVVTRYLGNHVMGEVKQFSSINNLHILLANEGFSNVKIAYIGGMWVLIELPTPIAKDNLLKHVGVASWFNCLSNAKSDFVSRERIVWVDIEGVPLHAWSRNTFLKIGSKWGDVLDLEECKDDFFARKRICIKTKQEDNVLEKFKIIVKGKVFVVRAKELFTWFPTFTDVPEMGYCSDDESAKEVGMNLLESCLQANSEEESDNEVVSDTNFGDNTDKDGNTADFVHNSAEKEIANDPFNIYDLLNKQKKDVEVTDSDASIPFPPGFTPKNAMSKEVEQDMQTVHDQSPSKSLGCSSRILESSQKIDEQLHSEALRKDLKNREGDSILEVLEEMIKVGQTMGFSMDGCLGSKAKKDWIRELNIKNKVSFFTLQETKMENISNMDVKFLWGNSNFDFIFSEALGNSGGILCAWDHNVFCKEHHIISDNFVALYETWISNQMKILMISVYAPQAGSYKRVLWSYLELLVNRWNGESIVMGDFNEFRRMEERWGSTFNAYGARAFNNFISNAGLVDLQLEGYSFTWAHPSATKMSKLDRFLVTDGLISSFPRVSAVCLDRHLSDHRPILLREVFTDYGATPFRLYHSWFSFQGFDQLVTHIWNSTSLNDSNGMIRFKKKLQILKKKIRVFVADQKKKQVGRVNALKVKLSNIDKILDQGGVSDDILLARTEYTNLLLESKTADARDYIQKAKIQWAVEGDENSKFFHGIMNRKHANLVIKGIMIDGEWVDDPSGVKNEFQNHFAARFQDPGTCHGKLDFAFPNCLSIDQAAELEKPISKDEIRNAVWGCGENKSPGPDRFTFEFFCKFWHVVGSDFCTAVEWFFDHASISIGVYKVITKILQPRLLLVISDLISDVQTVFLPNRQILDGPFIINELLARCHYKKQRAMVFKVDFAKAYDSIRWDYLEDVLHSFGFGSKWCSWIRGCLNSSMASILVNGSPTSEFQFHCGLKQGDPLAPYLFILVMESLHLSFSRVIDAGIFTGVRIDPSIMISHLFYEDDAVLIGEWSQDNLKGIMHMLRCFSLLSGLSINIKKSHLLGVGIPSSQVLEAATSMGCSVMKAPFKYLVVTIGGNTSLVNVSLNLLSRTRKLGHSTMELRSLIS